MVERSEAGMAQWVQHHVSALVQSANEGNWFAPAAPSSVGASCESTSNDRATEADGADEEDRESITLSHGARGNHGEHAGNS